LDQIQGDPFHPVPVHFVALVIVSAQIPLTELALLASRSLVLAPQASTCLLSSEIAKHRWLLRSPEVPLAAGSHSIVTAADCVMAGQELFLSTTQSDLTEPVTLHVVAWCPSKVVDSDGHFAVASPGH